MFNILKKTLILACAVMLMTTMASAHVFVVNGEDTDSTYASLAHAFATIEGWGSGPHQVEVRSGDYSDYMMLGGTTLEVPTTVDAITGPEAEKAPAVFTNPIANPSFTNPVVFLDVQGTSGLTISNLKIVGYFAGLVTAGPMATDLTVENCVFDGNIGGVWVASNNGTFDGLEIMNGWSGIQLFSFVGSEAIDDNTIINCSIHNCSRAPAIFFDVNESFYGNLVASMDGNTIENCQIFDGSDQAILLWGRSGMPITNTTVNGNAIYNNQWNAVAMNECVGGSITNNTAYGNVKGSVNPDSTDLTNTWAEGAIQLRSNTSGIAIQYNNVYDNGGLASTGDGTAYADYAVAISDNTCTGNNVKFNCLYDHDGVQGLDEGDGTNVWRNNYYSDLAAGAGSYTLDGTPGEVDTKPRMRMNTVVATTPMDVLSTQVVDFMFEFPEVCDAVDSVGLAGYEFTVSWDPTLLSFVGGDNDEFVGEDGLYIEEFGNAASGSITFSGVNTESPNYEEGRLAWAEFEAIGLGAATITLSCSYRDSANNEIAVENVPFTIDVVDNEAPAVTVNANDPVSGTDTYSAGSSHGGDLELIIDGDLTDQFGLKDLWFKIDAGSYQKIGDFTGTSAPYGPYTVDYTAYGIGEGTGYQLCVLVRDVADNRDSVFYEFNVDHTGPSLTSLVLADAECPVGPEYTNDLSNVEVTLAPVDPADVDSMEFSDGAGWQGAVPYAAVSAWDFSASSPPYQLWGRLYDHFGNYNGHRNDIIVFDDVPSTPSGLTLDGGAPKTADVTVSVGGTWSASTGSAFYLLSEDPADLVCGSADWVDLPLGTPGPWSFDFDIEATEGEHWVFRACRDSAGNVSAIDSASIIYDVTAPEFLSFDINGGAACTDNATTTVIDVTWDASLYGDATTIYLSLDTTAGYTSFAVTGAGSQQIPFSMFPAWTGTDSSYTVWGYIEDDIANASPIVSDDIFLDGTNPTIDNIVLNAGDNWVNGSAVVEVTLDNVSADATHILMGTTSGTYTDTVALGGTIEFDFGSPTECSWQSVKAVVMDCSGRMSGEVSDGLRFDFTAPEMLTMDIAGVGDGADSTRSRNVEITFTYDENCIIDQMMVSEDPNFAGATWEAVVATDHPYTLTDPGDGLKTVYVKVIDKAGNVSNVMSDDIYLDETDPTGTAYLQQAGTTMADSGWTNSTDVEIVLVDQSFDTRRVQFRDASGAVTSSWQEPVPATFAWTLADAVSGTPSTETVQIRYQDYVGNTTGWIDMDIQFDDVAPAAPAAGSAGGIPGASIDCWWGEVPNAQYYYVKYNATGLYPTYDSGIAFHPGEVTGDTLEGHFATMTADTTYTLGGPDSSMPADIYSLSIWTIDMAGNISAMPNVDITETNYRLGDVNLDGTIDFVTDFGTFATCYLEPASCNEALDFGPTNDSTRYGYPMPDGLIGFEDLMIIGLNYDEYTGGSPKVAVPSEISIAASTIESPASEEVVVTIEADHVAGIKAYQLEFDYDNSAAELVSAEAGQAFADHKESFFHHHQTGTTIGLTGMVLGERSFENSELARLVFRSQSGEVNLEALNLTVRDRENNDLQVTFNAAPKVVLPTAFALSQNYPNPFNPTTTIQFSLPVASDYRLSIYNITGQLVRTFEGAANAGVVSVTWDASNQSSGVYFYRLEASSFSQTKKMVLLK